MHCQFLRLTFLGLIHDYRRTIAALKTNSVKNKDKQIHKTKSGKCAERIKHSQNGCCFRNHLNHSANRANLRCSLYRFLFWITLRKTVHAESFLVQKKRYRDTLKTAGNCQQTWPRNFYHHVESKQ